MAREYQVYSLFQEMMPALRTLSNEEKDQLKKIAFNNTMLKAIKDQRKFIRDIRGLIKNDTYGTYFEEQKNLQQIIQEKYNAAEIKNKVDIDMFAMNYTALAEELQLSMEKALLRSRSQQLKAKPSENVSKSIALLMEIDSRQFGRMNAEEKELLKAELDELEKIVAGFKNLL